jgi:hypothetical protein
LGASLLLDSSELTFVAGGLLSDGNRLEQIVRELSVSLRPILQFAESLDSDPAIKAALGELSESGNDSVALTLTSMKQSASVRLSVDEGVLKSAAAGVRAAQGQ